MKYILLHKKDLPGIATAQNSNGGFIALVSVLLISVVLLLMVTTLSLGGYIGRFNILNSELKRVSASLADACANTAVLKLAEDWNYSGNETSTVSGSNTCHIFSVTTVGANPQTLKAQAVYRNSYTNLAITVQQTPFSILSWNEIPHLP